MAQMQRPRERGGTQRQRAVEIAGRHRHGLHGGRPPLRRSRRGNITPLHPTSSADPQGSHPRAAGSATLAPGIATDGEKPRYALPKLTFSGDPGRHQGIR